MGILATSFWHTSSSSNDGLDAFQSCLLFLQRVIISLLDQKVCKEVVPVEELKRRCLQHLHDLAEHGGRLAILWLKPGSRWLCTFCSVSIFRIQIVHFLLISAIWFINYLASMTSTRSVSFEPTNCINIKLFGYWVALDFWSEPLRRVKERLGV